jgi:predicted protein tyrosine phosphatase
MNIVVTDRDSIERGILVRSSYVVISIHDPDKTSARIPKQSGLRDILALAFHDAEPTEGMRLPENIAVMSEQQARQICEFVRKWNGKIGAVVVHCEQGMSRSPAVAAAVARCLGLDERCFRRDYQPNEFVYRLVVRAWSAEDVPAVPLTAKKT